MTLTKSSRKRSVRPGFRAAFAWHWKKNRVLTWLYTLLLMVALPGSFFLNLVPNMEYYLDTGDVLSGTELGWAEINLAQEMTEQFTTSIMIWGIPLMTLCALLLAVSSFGYLHNRRAIDLYNALPIRRTPMLFGGMAANLLQLFLPMAAVCGIIHALGRGYADLVYPFSGILVWEGFAVLVLTMTAAYLLFLFMIVISGTLLDAGFSYAVLSISWPIFWLCANLLCGIMLPGYCEEISSELYLALLPPLAGMEPFLCYDSGYCFVDPNYRWVETLPEVNTSAIPYQMSLGSLLWWLLFVVVFFVLVTVVFRIRKSECAENNVSFLLPRAVFRMIGSAAGGLGLGLLFSAIMPKNLVLVIGIVLGSFLTHLITQAVWTRGLRRFWRTLPAYLLLLVLLSGAGWMLINNGLGYVSYVPNTAEVESVVVEIYGAEGGNSKESYLAEQSGLRVYSGQESAYLYPQLWQQESIEAVSALHKTAISQYHAPFLPFSDEEDADEYDSGLGYLEITYYLKNGSVVHRIYSGIPDAEAMQQEVSAVTQLPEYQLYNLFDLYTADSIENIYYSREPAYFDDMDLFDEDAWEEMLMWEDEAGGFREDLTAEEKETLWATFLEELNSPDFSCEYNSYYEDASGVAYWEDYSINMTGVIQKNEFSPELAELLQQALGSGYDAVTEVYGESSYSIPESCTETRALIREYIAKGGEAEE